MRLSSKAVARSALIGALYALLTLTFAPISSGLMQVRISEALTVLPFLCPEAVPGLFLGCLIGNVVTGAVALDVIFGSLATLIAGALTMYLGKRGVSAWLAPLPAALMNGLIIGFLLYKVYDVGVSLELCMAYVAAGELIAGYALGMPLLLTLQKYKHDLFD